MKINQITAAFAVMLLSFSTVQAATNAASAPQMPKLILVIVVDQFRQDYTTRFRNDFTGGLKELLTAGAVFPDAHQDHYPTVTAVGHTTILTGSVPATSGIIGNEWYDRASGKVITSVDDPSTQIIGDPGTEGASPRNLIVSTVADELKIVHGAGSRVIGISRKDRAAILTVGRMADAAYWFDSRVGGFVTSSWYRSTLPDWVQKFNRESLPQQSVGKKWVPLLHPDAPPFLQLPSTANTAFYSAWAETPYSNEVLEQFAESALENEKLGRHASPDILTVSFSANDSLGHRVGPDAPEVQDMSIRTDRVIGKLIQKAKAEVGGLQNLLVVFTADHGVAPLPEVNAGRKLPGERSDFDRLLGEVGEKLSGKFGQGNWILSDQGSMVYLNRKLIAERSLSEVAVEDAAASIALDYPGVFRVYTRHEFTQHYAMQSMIDEYMARGFFAERSGDIYILMRPYVVDAASGTSHGTPYDYDSHVPLIFYGWRIRPGGYTRRTGISDIAPTLAAILNVETPSGSVGHILGEIVDR